ncbi:tRNA lysidine(34) synthetase TilS [Myroides pelagicus]|uniref:tRNA(Ile)-lysidine synthase n=1 Tax=Myroides pelagicus TaxID=270914 RepID=A0A7K1GKQ6_9FLAO|nr:tRNA lysidine(34) synthetase TilS [Myroides pelagicus]MEC4114280.1 tRNA lysidine(34) synthetase TilS [Myroides pelagicus]MTH29330.1 tRNA lysidine(34) synthetase TilS [Myroides pelagicus]
MLEQFKQHLRDRFPLVAKKRLLIAVSGGIDSVVLCHLCKEAKIPFVMAHCNFHLRGEDSNEDQAFVEALAQTLGVNVLVQSFDTEQYASEQKVSIQIAARDLRYDWFASLIRKEGYDYLLTAHHLDDSIETFLINFSRGTGITGLLGIPEQNDYILRPLLPFTREEIATYAAEHKITWREDYTNAQTKYLRNKFRKQIVPLLKEINPQFTRCFSDTISNLTDTALLANDASTLEYNKVVTKQGDGSLVFAIDKLNKLSEPKAYLYQWLQPYGFTAWDDIVHLLEAESGKIVYSKKYVLLKDRQVLILQPKSIEEENKEQIYYLAKGQNLEEPLKLAIIAHEDGEMKVDSTTILVDEDRLTFPLIVRKHRSGDKFVPFGMKGTKKVSKYFKDEKFNQFEKENTWLLCSGDEIVWVIGSRMDERFKIRSTTKNIIKIQITV